MRRSELNQALIEVFGSEIGPSLAADLILVDLDLRTVNQAVDDGVPPQRAWAALAREMGLAEEFPHRKERS